MALCDELPPRRAGVGADHLHRLLRAFAGRGHLGLYRRSFSQRSSLQGPGRGQRQPLVYEHRDSTGVSHGGGADWAQRSVYLLRRNDGDSVPGGAVCLPGDQGANAGSVAAQTGENLARLPNGCVRKQKSAATVHCGETAGAATGSLTSTAKRGKAKLPAASSITFNWQTYWPGLSPLSGTSSSMATASRPSTLTALACTSGVS